MRYTTTIVGGGITGLTVAYRLMRLRDQNDLPIDITLIESRNRLGGVIKSEVVDGFVIEHGPDAFLAEKPELKNLLTELGLAKELAPTNEINRQAYIAKNDKLIPLPSGFFMIAPTKWLSFLKSPLFSWLGKLRIALELFIPKKNGTNDESVAQFLRRRFGKELLTRAGQPLVGGIYMADIDLLSAQSTLAQFTNLENKFGSVINGLMKSTEQEASTASGARYNLFATLKNGTRALVDRLAEQLAGEKICLNTRMLSVVHGKAKKWQVQTTNGQFETDIIVFAMPAKLVAPAIRDLDPTLANALAQIESSNSVVVNLLYNKADLGKAHKGFGFVVPTIENRKIIAAGFISQKFSSRASLNHEMIRVFIGGQLAPDLWNLTDQALIDLAQNELSSYLDIKGPAIRSWLSRWPAGLPFYRVGHKDLVRNIRVLAKNHPEFFFSGSSYEGLGIPDCVRDGEKTAALLATHIQQSIQKRKPSCLSPTA